MSHVAHGCDTRPSGSETPDEPEKVHPGSTQERGKDKQESNAPCTLVGYTDTQKQGCDRVYRLCLAR